MQDETILSQSMQIGYCVLIAPFENGRSNINRNKVNIEDVFENFNTQDNTTLTLKSRGNTHVLDLKVLIW